MYSIKVREKKMIEGSKSQARKRIKNAILNALKGDVIASKKPQDKKKNTYNYNITVQFNIQYNLIKYDKHRLLSYT